MDTTIGELMTRFQEKAVATGTRNAMNRLDSTDYGDYDEDGVRQETQRVLDWVSEQLSPDETLGTSLQELLAEMVALGVSPQLSLWEQLEEVPDDFFDLSLTVVKAVRSLVGDALSVADRTGPEA